MESRFNLAIASALFVCLATGNACAEQLFSYKGIQVSVANDYRCQPNASVRLDAKKEDQIRQSRIDMQELSGMVKTYLWLDCEEIESITYEGFIEESDKRIYQAVAEKKGNWYLDEKSPNEIDANNKTKNKAIEPPQKDVQKVQQKQRTKKNNSKPSTLKELEKASAKGSVESIIELAKGLLGLSNADPNIKFPNDNARGLGLLEKMAADGNLDAKHLLGEAYQSNDQLPMNLPLLEKITSDLLENASQQRGKLAAKLTIESAAKGGKEAIVALKEAGQSGSGLSYYALGVMYLLDKLKQMPVDTDFIQEQLEVDPSATGSGGFGNADVGLHFLTLAAEKGNADAQGLLTEMDVDYNTSGSAQSSASSTSMSQAQSSMPSQNSNSVKSASSHSAPSGSAASSNKLAQGMALMESGGLDAILQAEESGSASYTQSGGGGSATSNQQQGGVNNNLNGQQGSGAKHVKSKAPSSVGRGMKGILGETPRGTLSSYSPNKPKKGMQKPGFSEANQSTEEKPLEILD